jgi:hypothetical protein
VKSSQTRPFLQEAFEQGYLPIPNVELEEPSVYPLLVDNDCRGPFITSRGTPALLNIPANTTIEGAGLNKDVKLQSDSPYSIDSNALSNTVLIRKIRISASRGTPWLAYATFYFRIAKTMFTIF